MKKQINGKQACDYLRRGYIVYTHDLYYVKLVPYYIRNNILYTITLGYEIKSHLSFNDIEGFNDWYIEEEVELC